jgi:hypothetical protein
MARRKVTVNDKTLHKNHHLPESFTAQSSQLLNPVSPIGRSTEDPPEITPALPEIASPEFTDGSPPTIDSSGFAGSGDLPLRSHLSLLDSFSQTPDLSLSLISWIFSQYLTVSLFRLTLCSS